FSFSFLGSGSQFWFSAQQNANWTPTRNQEPAAGASTRNRGSRNADLGFSVSAVCLAEVGDDALERRDDLRAVNLAAPDLQPQVERLRWRTVLEDECFRAAQLGLCDGFASLLARSPA